MWKLVIGFIAFAGLALYMLSKGGDIDLGGEKHGAEPVHAPSLVASATSAEPVGVAFNLQHPERPQI